jgi:hypothetical protein
MKLIYRWTVSITSPSDINMARALELMVGNRVSIVFFVSLQISFGDHTRAASFRSFLSFALVYLYKKYQV